MSGTKSELTGAALREAALRLQMSQRRVAQAAGLSIQTVHRAFNTTGELDLRSTTIAQIARVLGLGEPVGTAVSPPFMAINLPVERLMETRVKLPGLFRLYELSLCESREEILLGLEKVGTTRVTIVVLRGDDLIIERMGEGIRWGGRSVEGANVLDVGDIAIARAAAERYWQVLLSWKPVLQYVRSTVGLEYVVLSVPADRESQPSVVSVSAIGRYFI